MEKTAILAEINYCENRLSSYRVTLRSLEEQYSVLEEFDAKCATHINSFDASMNRRKNRLLNFDTLLLNVKSAIKYKNIMNDMLTGSEYTTAVSAIDQLQSSVAGQKSKIITDVQYTEDRIRELEIRIKRLQEEYNSLIKEVAEDVSEG